MIYDGNSRILIKNDNLKTTTNDYDPENLKEFIKLNLIQKSDFIFVAGHFLTRCAVEQSTALMETAASIGAKIIFDMVPHDLYTKITLEEFNAAVRGKADMLIGEYNTFMGLLGKKHNTEKECAPVPSEHDLRIIMDTFDARIVDIRYGDANISEHILFSRGKNGVTIIQEGGTGYPACSSEKPSGFGDTLTAKIFEKVYFDVNIAPCAD
jgi:hypothetical protein